MPQSRTNSRKKKKGRAPAHQNKFAFQHNPKSRLTEKILSSPIQHVCRRCRDKIEWRKKYRKYKPRTQPGICNLCRRRNVLAAYHTICVNCTVSAEAYRILDELNGEKCIKEYNDPIIEIESLDHVVKEKDAQEMDKLQFMSKEQVRRVCAMCVKDEALVDEEEDSIEKTISNLGHMSLRRRKALERGILKNQREKIDGEEINGCISEDISHNDEEFSSNFETDSVNNSDNNNDYLDPFLKAIGGTKMMLTGEAYQQMLLQKEERDLDDITI